jgi:hypothetical protein
MVEGLSVLGTAVGLNVGGADGIAVDGVALGMAVDGTAVGIIVGAKLGDTVVGFWVGLTVLGIHTPVSHIPVLLLQNSPLAQTKVCWKEPYAD